MLKNEFEGFSTLVRGCFNIFDPHSETGFFYYESDHQTSDNVINNWSDFTDKKIWLITARHNIYPSPPQEHFSPLSDGYQEYLPYEFGIYLKSNNSPKWGEIMISDNDLLKNGRIHNDTNIDIAAIEITDILKDKLKEDHYIDYYAFHKNQFPTSINDNVCLHKAITGKYNVESLFSLNPKLHCTSQLLCVSSALFCIFIYLSVSLFIIVMLVYLTQQLYNYDYKDRKQ
jgi:hypothetical protein